MYIGKHKDLAIGDLVYWEDPDSDLCTGEQRVAEILTDSKKVESLQTLLVLTGISGDGNNVVTVSELH